MTRTGKQLDLTHTDVIADAVIELMTDLGYDKEEFVPGLAVALGRLSRAFPNPSQAIDEVIEMLEVSADGVVG